jgi:ribosomal protein L11 methyltransferase
VAVEVRSERLEEARAAMITLFPEGFEEVERPNGSFELIAYTDAAGEERVWHVFGGARSTDVADGWEDRWRAFHRPVRVGGLWIGPPWERPPGDAISVVIDPGRAFGTGAHPTTQLCLQLLQEIVPGPLLDVGCGSGVLSIAAALLGFDPVTAVDVEVPAVEATLLNARANGVRVDAQVVREDDALPQSETAVANISMAAVAAVGARIQAESLIASGYLEVDVPSLPEWTHVDRRVRDGWAADVFRRA